MRHLAWLAAVALSAPALAQTAHHGTGGHDETPVYYYFRTNRLDYGASQAGARAAWDIDARIGTDTHRLLLKSEGVYIRGKGHEAEVQLLYSTPLGEFFDLQVGARQSFIPVGRSYVALGVHGLLPWFIETEATLFVSTLGQPSARVKAEIELPWTGHITSRPTLELNAYASDDRQAGTFAGVGTVKLAVQTRYQLTSQLAPYVELGWKKALGQTGSAARRHGERTDNAYSVVGLRLLY